MVEDPNNLFFLLFVVISLIPLLLSHESIFPLLDHARTLFLGHLNYFEWNPHFNIFSKFLVAKLRISYLHPDFTRSLTAFPTVSEALIIYGAIIDRTYRSLRHVESLSATFITAGTLPITIACTAVGAANA